MGNFATGFVLGATVMNFSIVLAVAFYKMLNNTENLATTIFMGPIYWAYKVGEKIGKKIQKKRWGNQFKALIKTKDGRIIAIPTHVIFDTSGYFRDYSEYRFADFAELNADKELWAPEFQYLFGADVGYCPKAIWEKYPDASEDELAAIKKALS